MYLNRINAGNNPPFRRRGNVLAFTSYDGIEFPAEAQVVFERGSFPVLNIGSQSYKPNDRLRISFDGCIANLSVRRILLSATLEFHRQVNRKKLNSIQIARQETEKLAEQI